MMRRFMYIVETKHPSVEMYLIGHWKLRDATVSGKPMIELAEEYVVDERVSSE